MVSVPGKFHIPCDRWHNSLASALSQMCLYWLHWMSCWYSNGSPVASSMMAWTNNVGGLVRWSFCTSWEYWEMTLGLQVQRLFCWCAGLTSVAGKGVGMLWMGKTKGLSGRSGLGAVGGGINAGERSAFGTGACVGTSVSNFWIASILSLKPGGKSLITCYKFCADCTMLLVGYTCRVWMLWCWKVTVSEMHSTPVAGMIDW